MPSTEWNAKRKRQFEHIEQGLVERGRSEAEAREVAGRTVNKTRAQAGESATASRTSVQDESPARRGGRRSHGGAKGRTFDQLYAEARERKLPGRSAMNKHQLEKALAR